MNFEEPGSLYASIANGSVCVCACVCTCVFDVFRYSVSMIGEAGGVRCAVQALSQLITRKRED